MIKSWFDMINIKVNGKDLGNNSLDARCATERTPTIFKDEVIFQVKNQNKFPQNLNASILLAEYLLGISASAILGSDLEKAFYEANLDDFSEGRRIKWEGEKFENYIFDVNKSDGNITMPTYQKYGDKNFYVLNGQTFDKFGNKIDIEIKEE